MGALERWIGWYLVAVATVAGCTHASNTPRDDSSAEPARSTQAIRLPSVASPSGSPDSEVKFAVERAPSISRRLVPDATAAHVAHGCGVGGTGRYVTIILEPDGPFPYCVVVTPLQRLRVVNHMVAVLHSHARSALVGFAGVRRTLLPVGGELLLDQAVGSYLDHGEHFLYYDRQHGRLDVWLR